MDLISKRHLREAFKGEKFKGEDEDELFIYSFNLTKLGELVLNICQYFKSIRLLYQLRKS